MSRVRRTGGGLDSWIVIADLFAGILLFVIMGVGFYPRPAAIGEPDPQATISLLKARIQELEQQVKRLSEELEKKDERLREMEARLRRALEESRYAEEKLNDAEKQLLDAKRQPKLSDIPPECSAQPLFDAVIAGERRYKIGGTIYSFDEIQARYRKQIGEALRTPCVHRVIARPSEGLSVHEYLAGLWPLETLFYVLKRQ